MWGSSREIVLTENVLSYLPCKIRVLDLGCGDGYLSYLLTKRGSAVVGIDVSSSRIVFAHGKCSTADFVVADGRCLPFCSRIFDSVVCCEVFEHVPNYQLIIGEMYRVTRNGGTSVVTVVNRMKEHVHSFNEQKICGSLSDGRWTVIRMSGISLAFEGIGKRFPSQLRVFLHRITYTLTKKAHFLLAVSHKS